MTIPQRLRALRAMLLALIDLSDLLAFELACLQLVALRLREIADDLERAPKAVPDAAGEA